MPYKDPEVRREKARKYSQAWRDRQQNFSEMRKLYPSYGTSYSRATDEAAVAHEHVKRAIQKGLLTRPNSCEKCGVAGRVEASHRDYSKPLDVQWLCRLCHRRLDANKPAGGTTKLPRKGRRSVTPEEKRAYRSKWMREFRAKKKKDASPTTTAADARKEPLSD